ncbi:cell cycle checkpoint [Pluteus cervinus]|uniref:Cell cycle checkpoint n=1 Tax=Pluteus cervinus TaxID=181527 RepID=A0ACD3ACA0_9AGAR|nr:cell cycle checkpoint [Pluteus cervinus]
MRFRATLDNVSTFFKIMQTIEKLQKKCIIQFSENYMRIICRNDANEGGVEVWSKIKVDSLFTNYRIQSMADNTITLELYTEALLAALRSATASSSNFSTFGTDVVTMRLAKKNNHAVLALDIQASSRVGKPVSVTHDVMIELMSPQDAERLNEPMCPDPNLHIILPPLHKLRTIVDRLKPMSDILAIRANHNGCLRLSINTESVKVNTEWRKCTLANFPDPTLSQEQEPEDQPDPDQLFSCLVSVRSFLKFLNSHVVSTTTIAAICQNHCIILYVYIGDVTDAGGVLTFYIPAIIDDENF